MSYKAFDEEGNAVEPDITLIEKIDSIIYYPGEDKIEEKEEESRRPLSKSFQLVLKNEHLDRGMFVMYEQAFRELYLELNPGKWGRQILIHFLYL